MLPFLKQLGWEPEVLCVQPDYIEGQPDLQLGQSLPSEIPVHRCTAFPLGLTRLVGSGQIGYRAYFQLGQMGDRLLASGRFDLIYISTAITQVFNLGPRWFRRFGIPFILDLHDPWLTESYSITTGTPPPGGRFKFQVSQFLARLKERAVLGSATHVTSVSESYPKLLCSRYPELQRSHFTALPFAAPRHDFQILDNLRVETSLWPESSAHFRWLYLGRMVPAMRIALRGFFNWFSGTNTTDGRNPEAWFVGTKYLRSDRVQTPIRSLASEAGVAARVHESEDRVPYFEGLSMLRKADALLLIGSEEEEYTPSKLYSLLLARRPLLALIHRRSPSINKLRSCSNAAVVPFDPSDSPSTIAGNIRKALKAGRTESQPDELSVDESRIEPFTDLGMTRTLANLFTTHGRQTKA